MLQRRGAARAGTGPAATPVPSMATNPGQRGGTAPGGDEAAEAMRASERASIPPAARLRFSPDGQCVGWEGGAALTGAQVAAAVAAVGGGAEGLADAQLQAVFGHLAAAPETVLQRDVLR